MRMKVDMAMLTKLLRTMYSRHPVEIGVRETLQNAGDACKKAGVTPRITIKIERTAAGTWVICDDNGCGMDLDTIENCFLQIGNPHKELEQGATGRFGVGIKVAVNSQSEWYVRTNEFAFDNTFLEDPDRQPDVVAQPRQGTEVGIYCKEQLGDAIICRAMEMVYFSEVAVHFIYKLEGETVLDEITSPYQPTLREGEHKGFDCYLAPVSKFNKAYLVGGPRNIHRINGLVQFVSPGSDGRKTNLVFDFHDTPYPFTPSREQLRGDIYFQVNALINKHNVDAVSSLRRLSEPPIQNVLSDGYLLNGRRGVEPEEVKDAIDKLIEEDEIKVKAFGMERINAEGVRVQEIRLSNWRSADIPMNELEFYTTEELARKVLEICIEAGELQLPEEPEPVHKHPALLFKNYQPKSIAIRNADTNLLKVWIELIQMCADPRDQFGAGLTSEELTEGASRTYSDGKYFYMLNPSIVRNVRSKEGKVLALWGVACHECSHFSIDQHDEYFTCEEGHIQRLTATEMFENIKTLKRML